MDSTASRKPSPSLVISMLALFVALSGSAVALSGKSKIDHNDLRKHVVHRSKIHNQAINSAKVQDESLGAVDLAPDSVESSELATNSVVATHIAANAVGASEIASGAVHTAELANGAVTVAKLEADTGVITVNFPSIDPGDCEAVTPVAPGVTTTDNLIVTPNHDFTSFLTWNARQPIIDGVIFMSACNPTAGAINPDPTLFRYLAIHP